MLLNSFSRFQPINVLVLGDLMLDAYTTGKVERISPEAPVPVLRVKEYKTLPGGAGNVVLNLLSLGARVFCAGRVGADDAGRELAQALSQASADVSAVITEIGFLTPLKNRLIADGQQLMRIDNEVSVEISEQAETALLERIEPILDQVDIVAISDYGKGLLSKSLLDEVIKQCQKRKIAVVVDPKGNDFSKYRGATLVKPNLKEALAAAKLGDAPLERVAAELLSVTKAQMIMITLSEKGIALFRKKETNHFPALSKEVVDVTGAGDTVLAIIALALGSGLAIEEACHLANVAAGIAIEKVGCVRITLSEMSERLLAFDSANKIFNEDHLCALKHILKKEAFNILALEPYEAMTPDLLRVIKELGSREEKLLLYCLEGFHEEFIALLTSLKEVAFVVMKSESLAHLCQEIEPIDAFIYREKALIHFDQPSYLLESLSILNQKKSSS
jgi:D-beta-D-heptose 7-phosphate kinase/D-beta-D-heptose 1-phosphate adenosyltransferase